MQDSESYKGSFVCDDADIQIDVEQLVITTLLSVLILFQFLQFSWMCDVSLMFLLCQMKQGVGDFSCFDSIDMMSEGAAASGIAKW